MKLADLADEAERRGFDLLQHTPKLVTREELIRAISQHVQENHVPSITTSAATSTRMKTAPPWRSQGTRNPAGSPGQSTALSSGPPRMHRPWHVLSAQRRARSLGPFAPTGEDLLPPTDLQRHRGPTAMEMEYDMANWDELGNGAGL